MGWIDIRYLNIIDPDAAYLGKIGVLPCHGGAGNRVGPNFTGRQNAVITGVSGWWYGDFAQLIVGEAQIADRAGSCTAADHVSPGNGGVHRKVRAGW